MFVKVSQKSGNSTKYVGQNDRVLYYSSETSGEQ